MTGKQMLGRMLLAVLVIGLLAAAGYVIYRLGFNTGLASAMPAGGMREWMFERGPRLGWPDRFHPHMQEPMIPGAHMYSRGTGLFWPWAWTSWFGFGVLLLTAGVVVGLLVALFRWAFRPAPSAPAPVEPESPQG